MYRNCAQKVGQNRIPLFAHLPANTKGPVGIFKRAADLRFGLSDVARGSVDFSGFNAEMLQQWSSSCGAFWPCRGDFGEFSFVVEACTR